MLRFAAHGFKGRRRSLRGGSATAAGFGYDGFTFTLGICGRRASVYRERFAEAKGTRLIHSNGRRMIAEAPAPWFFKQRFALFGAVYGLSFFGGFCIAGLLGIAPRPLFLSSAHPLALALAGIVCVLGGYALRVWASSYIAATIVWTQDVQLGELTVSGPYRFTRNPLYLGNLLQAMGIGILGPWPVFALLTLLMAAYCFVLISVEEPHLARKNGAAYEAYRAKVSQFVPVLGRVAPDGGRHGAWRAGLKSERMTGIVTIVILADFLYQLYARVARA